MVIGLVQRGKRKILLYISIYDIMFMINFNCKYINESINTHTHIIYIYIYIHICVIIMYI